MHVFCDLLQLSIPIRRDPRWSRGGSVSHEDVDGLLLSTSDVDDNWLLDEAAISEKTGFGMSARDVQVGPGGAVSVQRLAFHWDSLPTSYTGIGVKIFNRHGGRRGAACGVPRVVLRCSPAKVLQGHNLTGDVVCIRDAAEIVISRAFAALPELVDLVDLEGALVDEIHVTGGVLCATPTQVQQVIERLRSFRYRHWRAADTAESDLGRGLSGYKTSLYFSPASEFHRAVLYHKGPEFLTQLEQARKAADRAPGDVLLRDRVRLLERPELQADADKTARFEGRWLRRGIVHFLAGRGIAWDGTLLGLVEIEWAMAEPPCGPGENLFRSLWAKSWRPVFAQLENGDPDMGLTNI